MTDIVKQLRSAINESGATIRSLAQDLEIPQPVLHRFAKGERSVRLETAARIAKYFGMELTEPKSLFDD